MRKQDQDEDGAWKIHVTHKEKFEQYLLPKELTTKNFITETLTNEKKWNKCYYSAKLG